VFDWIQVALLDAVCDAAATADRRRNAALELRLLRSECGRAAAMLQEELSYLLDSLQVSSWLIQV
jgi:hypothetical protein